MAAARAAAAHHRRPFASILVLSQSSNRRSTLLRPHPQCLALLAPFWAAYIPARLRRRCLLIRRAMSRARVQSSNLLRRSPGRMKRCRRGTEPSALVSSASATSLRLPSQAKEGHTAGKLALPLTSVPQDHQPRTGAARQALALLGTRRPRWQRLNDGKCGYALR